MIYMCPEVGGSRAGYATAKKLAVILWVRKTDAFKATVLGVSAKAIAVALQDFARVLEGRTTAFNSWASRQEEIAARLAAVERRLQLVNAKHARPARRKPGAKPLLELVK
jgi:hypothetical protein